MKPPVPPLHKWLREAVLHFYQDLPEGIADLKIDQNDSHGVFIAEIVPRSEKAARISVTAEAADWEAMVAFGKESQIDARYYDHPDGEASFKEEVLRICKTVASNYWKERIFRRGDKEVKTVAILPPPVGRAAVTRWNPFSSSRLRKQTEEIIRWEPYISPPPSSDPSASPS